MSSAGYQHVADAEGAPGSGTEVAMGAKPLTAQEQLDRNQKWGAVFCLFAFATLTAVGVLICLRLVPSDAVDTPLSKLCTDVKDCIDKDLCYKTYNPLKANSGPASSDSKTSETLQFFTASTPFAVTSETIPPGAAPSCAECAANSGIDYHVWYPNDVPIPLSQNLSVYLYAPATGQSPSDYSSTLSRVASHGMIAVAVYIDWSACYSGICGTSTSLTNCYVAWEDKLMSAIKFITEGSLDKHLIGVSTNTSSIAVGGHSGATWPVLASIAKSALSARKAVRSVILQHSSKFPSPYDKELFGTKSAPGAGRAAIAAIPDLKMMTICGNMCTLTCDPCLLDSVGSAVLGDKVVSDCATGNYDCSDCMPYAGCTVTGDYIDRFLDILPNGTAMYVRGPWWHLAPENTELDSYTACGSTEQHTPETPYVIGWLMHIFGPKTSPLTKSQDALDALLSQNSTSTTFAAPRCGREVRGPIIAQIVKNKTIVPNLHMEGIPPWLNLSR